MRDHLATLLDDFRRYHSEIAVVRYQGQARSCENSAQPLSCLTAGARSVSRAFTAFEESLVATLKKRACNV